MGVWRERKGSSNSEMRERENRRFWIPMGLVMKTEEIDDWVKRQPTLRVQAMACL